MLVRVLIHINPEGVTVQRCRGRQSLFFLCRWVTPLSGLALHVAKSYCYVTSCSPCVPPPLPLLAGLCASSAQEVDDQPVAPRGGYALDADASSHAVTVAASAVAAAGAMGSEAGGVDEASASAEEQVPLAVRFCLS